MNPIYYHTKSLADMHRVTRHRRPVGSVVGGRWQAQNIRNKNVTYGGLSLSPGARLHVLMIQLQPLLNDFSHELSRVIRVESCTVRPVWK